jgi:cell division protein FtsW (lipid II flippase)
VRKGRVALLALVTGVLVGARSRRRSVTERSPTLVSPKVRADLHAVERRLDHEVARLDRDRLRSAATVLALAVLILIPAVLVTTRPDVPDVVIATVLAVAMLIAAGALLAAATVGRTTTRSKRQR